MNAPDEYYDAALICITLICEGCEATLDSEEDLPQDQPRFGGEGDWVVALGNEAYRRGWKISTGADGLYRILCPLCGQKEDEPGR